jgi:hypothetical protein
MHIREFKRRIPNTFDEYKGIKTGDSLHLRFSPDRKLTCLTFYRGRYNQVYVAHGDEPNRPDKVTAAYLAKDYLEFH